MAFLAILFITVANAHQCYMPPCESTEVVARLDACMVVEAGEVALPATQFEAIPIGRTKVFEPPVESSYLHGNFLICGQATVYCTTATEHWDYRLHDPWPGWGSNLS